MGFWPFLGRFWGVGVLHFQRLYVAPKTLVF